ncbi:MAG TPA: hypothetical protein VHO24_16480 [Opitutaceae bacterium]|nr:hypothetical protein [Opitutaceae bacterium]
MPQPDRSRSFPAPLICAGAALLLGACAVFVPTHTIAVDAISGPVTSLGTAYRLADKDPMAIRNAAQHKLVFTCVGAALDTKGIFEAPAGTKQDFNVEVDYGVNRGTGVPRMMGVMGTTELFLQLSARRPKAEGARGKGEEVWNVRVSVMEDGADLGSVISVLAIAAADYAGLDTQTEKSIKVSEKDPRVLHVKSVARTVLQPPRKAP